MPYERTREIEQRFQKAIDLLGRKQLNARQLALELGVSRPTAQRIITELRNRGHKIRSVRDESGWRYELMDGQKASQTRS
ncbi:MAG: HTH domain-containing protein [Dehalococcoidales bacterium]|jgi:predicted DNA-binding transcriptional regulator YafY|nr:HTH domain-containing protein [Dehalococcoidales bacterium]